MKSTPFCLLISVLCFGVIGCARREGETAMTSIEKATIDKTVSELVARHGTGLKDRIERGVGQAAGLWTKEDGSDSDFTEFCTNQFIADTALLRKRSSLMCAAGEYSANR